MGTVWFLKRVKVKNKDYLKKILSIVGFYNIPPIFFIFSNSFIPISFLLGSLGSCLNFILITFFTEKAVYQNSRKSIVKGSYIRNLFLIIYSVFLILFLPINIISFGVGLLMVQISIFTYEIYLRVRILK